MSRHQRHSQDSTSMLARTVINAPQPGAPTPLVAAEWDVSAA